MSPGIALIGPGRVGSAVCKRLYDAGYPLTSIIGRSQEKATEACAYIGCTTTLASTQLTDAATADIILLAVPDDQIPILAVQIQTMSQLTKPITLIHFSGLHPAKIMYHQSSPWVLLSIHPLLPFANRHKAYIDLQGCPCALESDNPEALLLGEKLVDAIGGHSFTVDHDKKPLYHAAACIASNYLVTLLASARDLLTTCGIEEEQAIPILLPLAQASLNNVRDFGPEQGLTGPIVRGDIGTVLNHIKSLKNDAPELLQLYLQMGLDTVKTSQKSGRLNLKIALDMQSLFTAEIEDLAGC